LPVANNSTLRSNTAINMPNEFLDHTGNVTPLPDPRDRVADYLLLGPQPKDMLAFVILLTHTLRA
jgi:hypothetical protein